VRGRGRTPHGNKCVLRTKCPRLPQHNYEAVTLACKRETVTLASKREGHSCKLRGPRSGRGRAARCGGRGEARLRRSGKGHKSCCAPVVGYGLLRFPLESWFCRVHVFRRGNSVGQSRRRRMLIDIAPHLMRDCQCATAASLKPTEQSAIPDRPTRDRRRGNSLQNCEVADV
jgi:hypothetical protein